MRGRATRCAEEPSLLDVTTTRPELAAHYDLSPSVELAREMSDIHARMDRVMPFPD